MFAGRYEWLLFVILAGLSWGTYVPLIFYGGQELPARPGSIGGRLMAILCVGVAYFVLAVVIPLGLFLSNQAEWPQLKTTGMVFAGLAGVAGAVGAICVVFATKSAVDTAKDADLDPSTYKMYIAPLIFALAPVINTVVSAVWHPQPDNPFHFELQVPGWKLWVGILLVGLGAGLVLFSKEEAEAQKKKAERRAPAPAVASAVTPPEEGRG